MTEFRQIEPGDAQIIADLHTASWSSAYRGIISDDWLDHHLAADRRDFWAARFAAWPPRSFGILALVDTEPVGFVFALPGTHPEWGTLIDNLHVLPGHKRHGLGRLLFARFAAHAIAIPEPDPVYLWVYEENHNARRFYQAMGGTPRDRILTPLPGGGEAPILRYCWDSPAAMLSAVTT